MGSNDFRELPERELSQLSDDELIDYMRTARALGIERAVRSALAVLVFGYLPIMERRAALKVRNQVDAQDIAADAIESALKAAFDGESVGEFRAWMNRIFLRRVADFHRRLAAKPEPGALPTGDEDDEKLWGEVPSVEFEGVPIDAHRAIETAWGELRPQHRNVTGLYIFGDLSAEAVAEQTGESQDNVHQIASRFRKRVRELLDEGETPTRP